MAVVWMKYYANIISDIVEIIYSQLVMIYAFHDPKLSFFALLKE